MGEAIAEAAASTQAGAPPEAGVDGVWGLVVGVLLVVSAFFLLTAALGVVRLPDFYSRANVSTVATTQGLLGVAVATTLFFSVRDGSLYLKDLLVFVFVFLTVPAGTHVMVRAAYYLGVPMARESVVDELAKSLAKRGPTRPAPEVAATPEAREGLEPTRDSLGRRTPGVPLSPDGSEALR